MSTPFPASPAPVSLVRRLTRLYRLLLLPGFALVMLVLLWVTVIERVAQEERTARNDAVARSQALARTLADQTTATLRRAEYATQLFALQFADGNGRLRLAEFTRRAGLIDNVLPVPLQAGVPLLLLDRDGRVTDSVHADAAERAANAGPNAWFARHAADSGAELPRFDIVRAPAPATRWQVRVSRRLTDASARFAGVLVILIDPDRIINGEEGLGPDADGLRMLLSEQSGWSAGRIGPRYVVSDRLALAPLPATPEADQDPLAERQTTMAPDRVARFYTARALPRYGLVSVVGLDRQRAMGKFLRHRATSYTTLVLGSVLVVVCVALLMQQAARVRTSNRAAREAQAMLRAAAHGSLDAVLMLKASRAADGTVRDFICVDLNERAANFIAVERSAILGQPILPRVPLMREPRFFQHYLDVMASGAAFEDEVELPRDGGSWWMWYQIVAIDDGVAISARDITARRQQAVLLQQNQAELAAVNDASPLGLVRSNRAGECTYVNRTFEAITGLTRDEAMGDGWMQAIHPLDRKLLLPAFERLTEGGAPLRDTMRCLHRDGTVVWTTVQIAPILVDGRIDGYVGTLEDITTLRESELALRESEARLRTIADTLPAMIAYVDADQQFRFMNQAYEREFGFDRTPQGQPALSAFGTARAAVLGPYVARVLAGETLCFEEELERDGVLRHIEVNYIPQRSEDGDAVIGFHIMRQDISAQKHEKQRLVKLAQLDALTGLANRAGFLQKLHDAMAQCREQHGLMAVMYMDIDRFKPVNDTHGHGVGDALLKAFSARLLHTMRASDTIGRLGGDEFTLIVERIGRADDAVQLAAKIVAAMQAPFELDGVTVQVSASIGLSFYTDGPLSPAELLKQADTLLYRAKQAGRNTYRSAPLPA